MAVSGRVVSTVGRKTRCQGFRGPNWRCRMKHSTWGNARSWQTVCIQVAVARVRTPRRYSFKHPNFCFRNSIKTNPQDSEWTRYAEFEIELTQNVRAAIQRPSFEERTLRLDWFGDADVKVTGRFEPDYKPINSELHTDRIKELFAHGWSAWTQSGPMSQVAIPDFDFGHAKLRISEVAWAAPYLYATFSAAGNGLTESKRDLVYAGRDAQHVKTTTNRPFSPAYSEFNIRMQTTHPHTSGPVFGLRIVGDRLRRIRTLFSLRDRRTRCRVREWTR